MSPPRRVRPVKLKHRSVGVLALMASSSHMTKRSLADGDSAKDTAICRQLQCCRGLVRSDVQVLAGEAFYQRLVGRAEQAVDGVDAPGIRAHEDAGFVLQNAFDDDFGSLVRGGHGQLVDRKSVV